MTSHETVLHYFEGRARAEIIRIVLCAANIKFREHFFNTREEWLQYVKDGRLPFEQVPLLEINGKQMIQTNAITRHIARISDLDGVNEDERTMIDALYEGTRDAYAPFYGFKMKVLGPDEEIREKIQKKTLPKYLPVYNKTLEENNTGYLVGDRLSLADLGLLEVLLSVIDYFTLDAMLGYPALQNFHKLMLSLPQIDHYIKNVRQRQNDDRYRMEVFTTLGR